MKRPRRSGAFPFNGYLSYQPVVDLKGVHGKADEVVGRGGGVDEFDQVITSHVAVADVDHEVVMLHHVVDREVSELERMNHLTIDLEVK